MLKEILPLICLRYRALLGTSMIVTMWQRGTTYSAVDGPRGPPTAIIIAVDGTRGLILGGPLVS